MAINTVSSDDVEKKSSVVQISETEPLWTVDDVADYLRLNPETVRVMARRGELPSIKVGRRVWRFKISEIKDWLKSQHEALDPDCATMKDRLGDSGQAASQKLLQ